MKRFTFGLVLFLSVSICGCKTTAEESQPQDGFSVDYFYNYYDEIFDLMMTDHYDDVFYTVMDDHLDDVKEYFRNEGYPDWPLLLDEAAGNAMATKTIFDLAEQIDYFPSAFFGPYCLDTSSWTFHNTNSDCVTEIPCDNIAGCWVFNITDYDSLLRTMTDNEYLSSHCCTLCAKCIPEQ